MKIYDLFGIDPYEFGMIKNPIPPMCAFESCGAEPHDWEKAWITKSFEKAKRMRIKKLKHVVDICEREIEATKKLEEKDVELTQNPFA